MRRLPLAAMLALAALGVPGGSARANSSGAGEGDLHLVPMETVTVPIVDSANVAGMLRFSLVLAAADGAAADRITASMPRLRAAALAAGLEFARLNVSPLRAVDAQQLDQALTAALRQAEPGVARVLITEVAAERR